MGSLAEVYADIRRCIGVPMVSLVYRHLASEPGRLEAAWDALRPNLVDEWGEASARELRSAVDVGRVVPVSAATLAVAGVDEKGLQRARNTVAAYNRANPRNLLAVCALLPEGPRKKGSRPRRRAAPPAPELELLRMQRLPVDDPNVQALLEEISHTTTTPDGQLLIPSLFRHLATCPHLLAVVWTAIRPVFAAADGPAQAEKVLSRAGELVRSLPYPLDLDSSFANAGALVRFPTVIARMIVAGAALSRALSRRGPEQSSATRRSAS